MYDLNLSIPNITSKKYSNDNRFLLLKNYLYELNETLSYALADKSQTEIGQIKNGVEADIKNQKENIYQLNLQSVSRFKELKEKILRTAEDIRRDYESAVLQSEQKILQTVTGEFVGKGEFGEYKSGVETTLEQTAADIKIAAENTETVANDLEYFKDETKSEMTVRAEAVMTQVESLYTTKTQSAELESKLSSQITQTEETITEHFSESVSKISEDISSVGGELSELVSSLDVYIRRGELESGIYGIEIGRSDSNIKARFTNNRLSFYQGIVEVAYISGSSLYITNAQILDYLKIGNSANGYFMFDTTENGLEVRWIDGI